MESANYSMTLLEGVGNELIWTTLVLGAIVILFNFYWVYLVVNRRITPPTEQAITTSPSADIQSTVFSNTTLSQTTQQQQQILTPQESSNELNPLIEQPPPTDEQQQTATEQQQQTKNEQQKVNELQQTTSEQQQTKNEQQQQTASEQQQQQTATEQQQQKTATEQQQKQQTASEQQQQTATEQQQQQQKTATEQQQQQTKNEQKKTNEEQQTTSKQQRQTTREQVESPSIAQHSTTEQATLPDTTCEPSTSNNPSQTPPLPVAPLLQCHASTLSLPHTFSDSSENVSSDVLDLNEKALLNNKMLPTPPNHLTIKLQFVNGAQRVVSASPEETLGDFKRVHFFDEVASNRKVRLIMNGQELKNDSWSLKAYKICNNFVLHCLVSQYATPTQPSPSSPTSQHQQSSSNFPSFGFLLYPLIGAVLAFFWYTRLYYRAYFNSASTFSLIVLTCIYALSSLPFFRISISSEHLHQR